MEKVYAQAIAKKVREGADEADLVKALQLHLERMGRVKLLPRIVAELKREVARNAKTEPVLELAHEGLREGALKELSSLGLSVSDIRINTDLIEGWRVRTEDTVLDKSAKRSLVELYKRITA
jgi:F0F1-type ATP synthase delta subunit